MFYASFSPSEETKYWSKNISILFFVCFVAVGVLFFVRNEHKLIDARRTKVELYAFAFVGFPILFILISYMHYVALSKGFSSLYTSFVADELVTDATITKKRLWGKRDRHEVIFLKGFPNGFNVSRRYYNSVSIGDPVKVMVKNSKLGAKIEFVHTE